jgi:hypothetical protein
MLRAAEKRRRLRDFGAMTANLRLPDPGCRELRPDVRGKFSAHEPHAVGLVSKADEHMERTPGAVAPSEKGRSTVRFVTG